ncbi:UvrD-helicase domain-containing protein [Synechococcus sp. L2F]|uniref:UvrD-helicase domain-containing protein n=1 Tax=Synechococcus sp. L2F TaxID=2823739 RepID=UPI0020CEC2F0|nr:UvrD-helicase domain-containing protein [Synechococcus sp. L2F]MCP9827383.1 UvrD-helicase domain-containing protein [Synechococcus sp. L2F]
MSHASSQPDPRANAADRPLLEFDANALPLSAGLRLLEASAGTGKTFALAHLVLRLVTEPHLMERPLALRELLVVTFTEAAAAELRDRIGRRFQQALEALEALQALEAPNTLQPHVAARPAMDAVLAGWLEQLPTGTNLPQLRARLLLALEELDAADITTIHGFCHRNLRRQALEAGLGPQLEVETEGAELAEQVVHDYWHSQVLPLPLHLLQGLKRAKVTQATLTGLLQLLEGDAALAPPPLPDGWRTEAPLQEQLTAFWGQVWERFKPLWAARGDALEQTFCASARQWKVAGASATTPYAGKPRTNRVEELNAWLATQPDPGSYAELRIDKRSWLPDYFHPAVFTKIAETFETPPVSLPERPLLEAVAALVDGPAEAVLAHFCHWGVGELRSRRQRAGRISYGELLRGLDPGPTGTGRPALIEALRRRYRAALIDEFQDTDPIQWRTLRQAFAPASGAGQHLLVIVGDPKQAIYRFRGGDLDTYLAARQLAARTPAAAGEPSIRSMRHNFRASELLVAALNHLMAPGLVRTDLPVPAVVAQPQRQALHLQLPPGQAPLQLLWLGPAPGSAAAGVKLPSKTALEQTLPRQIGALTLNLLQRGIEVHAHGEQRALEPGDICLLVSRHSQADALRRALEERGIASRLVSKGDVFESEGASALQRLLDALAEPGSGPRQRLLAASPLLGWSPRRLTAASPADWDALADRLARLAEGLGLRGLLGVLAELLEGEGLGRLSQSGRLLADLQQCAELVQEQMHNEQLGAVAAADWLRRRRRHPPNDPPERHQPHSDAVESAVRVVTVHRSKGLEFPVVICPYLWQAPPAATSAGNPGVRWTPPGAAGPSLDISVNQRWGVGREARQQKHQAEAQEAERLAYVALTRAMQLLVLVYGPSQDQEANPLRPWLFPGQPLSEPGDDDSSTQVLGPGDALSGLSWIQLPAEAAGQGRWQPPPRCGALHTGPVPQRLLDGNWGRSSYSSWTHSSSGGVLPPAALEDGRETDANTAAPPIEAPMEALRIEAAASATSGPATSQPGPSGQAGSSAATSGSANSDPASSDPDAHGPLQDFPRGASAGDCLHRILEQVDHQRRAVADPATAALVEVELGRAGIDLEQRDAVLAGLEQLRLTPMGGPLGSFRLADLPLTQRLNEMNFDLPLASEPAASRQSSPLVRAAGLAAPFRDHPSGAFGSAYASQLEQLPVASRGFLTGSIDLVFTAPAATGELRWWVADWKSNWLGERGENGQPLACGPLHYGPPAMAALMAANHYPLQAHLYLVALHRYLRWRLPGYTPERDLGGYVYVFLRGVPGERAQAAGPGAAVPGMFVEAVDPDRLLALDAALREGQP